MLQSLLSMLQNKSQTPTPLHLSQDAATGAGVAHEAAADGYAGHSPPYGGAYEGDGSSAGTHHTMRGNGCGAFHGGQPGVHVYTNACYTASESEGSADGYHEHLRRGSSDGSAGSSAKCARGWGGVRAAAHRAAACGASAGGCCGGGGLAPADECAAAVAAAEFVLS